MLVIAHLSDIHIGGSDQSVERADAVLRYLDAVPYDFDAVLVSGDLADHGLADEYEEVRKLLTSRHPVLTCPGNHDDRAEYRRVLLGEPPATSPINRVHRTAKALYALCDSTIPGQAGGRMDDETLTWLEGVLDGERELPVFVVFHHPPVLLHAAVDSIMLDRPEPLAELLSRYPNVAAVLVGHAHTAAATTFAGRPLLVGPGVVSTLLLPWEGGTTLRNCADYALPPGIVFHVLDDAGRLTTHHRVVQAAPTAG